MHTSKTSRLCASFSVFLFLFLLCIESSLAYEERIALVIGNSNYQEAPLKNPVNDAADIARKLEQLGFDTEVVLDQGSEEIQQKIEEFGQRLAKADVGFFYFAGHGLQYKGDNYLLPVSANLNSEKAIIRDAIATADIIKKMKRADNLVNIMVLDACRNNPFSTTKESIAGLAVMDAPAGSFIAYATAPGNVAVDGMGRNGLYTQYLLENLDLSGLNIEQLFKRVRRSVVKETKGKQVPWENSSLLGEFQFVEQLESSLDAVTLPLFEEEKNHYELHYWKLVQAKPERAMYEAYLKKFPKGEFSAIAREKLQAMGMGTLIINSNVFGDRIEIDNEYRGMSQLKVSLKPGFHDIKVSKDNYLPVIKRVKIKPGKVSQLNVLLTRQKTQQDYYVSRGVQSDVDGSSNTEARAVPKDSKPKEVEHRPEPALLADVEIKEEPELALSFVKIPAGCMTMGSPFGEAQRQNDELEHKVCLSKDFWLSQYEVTQAQWQKIMGYNPSFFKGCGGDCPVEKVSWDEVQHFIFKLNSKTGVNYRLPTEAEWEYAARAQQQTSTYIGNAEDEGENNAPLLDKIAWYSGNSGVSYKGGKYCEDWNEKQYPAYRCGTHPVGLKQPNAWGLYDVLGNVWEWTQDRYGAYSSKDSMDPKGSRKGYQRVVRGGSWAFSLNMNRLAARYALKQNKKSPFVGFRLVKVED